jgi:hypothetical protein
LEHIASLIEAFMDNLCRELVILNFGEQDKYPTFKFSGISDKAGKEMAEIVKMMIDGKVIIPDDNLEEHIRKRLNISPASDEGQREVNPQPSFDTSTDAGPGRKSSKGGDFNPADNFRKNEASLSEKISFAVAERRKNIDT